LHDAILVFRLRLRFRGTPAPHVMAHPDFHAALLKRAVAVLGDAEKLQRVLHVTDVELGLWLGSRARIPDRVFLQVVDLLAARELPLAFSATEGVGTSRFWDNDFLQMAGRQAVLDAAVDAALEITAAPLGNLQMRAASGLHIEAQRGFARPFLDFFGTVSDDACACGNAMAQGVRVVVPDVARSPIFAAAGREVVLQAGARSVQSTPIIAPGGRLLGVVSTHDTEVRDLPDQEARHLDALARRLAGWFDWKDQPRAG
jgi:hypothetical protein